MNLNLTFTFLLKARLILVLVVLASLSITSSCTEEEESQLATYALNFEHRVYGEKFELNKSYNTSERQAYTVQAFKYYISNISLENSQTGERHFIPDSYHLLQETGTGSARIILENIPRHNYDKIHLAWGIDAVKNTSLDNLGDLDPANEMAWNWNTGYKFLLLEGRLQPSERPMVYHIGFDHNFKELSFDLPENVSLQDLNQARFDFEVRIDQILEGEFQIDLEENNNVMGGPIADQIARNIHSGFLRFTGIQ